ncbi:MAG: hypothetical protein M1820_010616 [Bogoriella megaspora]|nr:MAG: hypothetical protein M1820_010616 [Bogoriella megaspora]
MAATAVVGSNLYFMGGSYMVRHGPVKIAIHVMRLYSSIYWVDLTDEFTLGGTISTDRLHSMAIGGLDSVTSQQTGYDHPSLFSTADGIYVFDSWENPRTLSMEQSIGLFNITTQTWNSVTVGGSPFNLNSSLYPIAASDQKSKTSYLIEGDSYTSPVTVRFNASDSTRVTWTGSSSGGASQYSSLTRNSANPAAVPDGLVYLPVGDSGALVGLNGGQNAAQDSPANYSLNSVGVYDIASGTWYNVSTTGPAPPDATSFCASVSAAQDQSSFQVHVYGGENSNSTDFVTDVWVLSIPSFQWIDISRNISSNEASDGNPAGRIGHTCTTINDSQMVVFGGLWDSASIDDSQDCPSSFPRKARLPRINKLDANQPIAIRVLDTSTYTWQSSFNPKVAYAVPGIVIDAIGGDATGNADARTPKGGFADPRLTTLFNKRISPPASQSSVPGSTTASATPAPPPPNSNQLSKGGIAGVAIGVGAAVAGVIGGVLAFIRWRRKRKSSAILDETSGMDHGVPRVSMMQEGEDWVKPELPGEESKKGKTVGSKTYAEIPGNEAAAEMEAEPVVYELATLSDFADDSHSRRSPLSESDHEHRN